MKLKNIVLATVAAGALIAGSSAFADYQALTVNNKTSLASTVQLVNSKGTKVCVTSIPGQAGNFTPANTTKTYPASAINLLCNMEGQTPCIANIFVGNSHDCTGTQIAQAALQENGTAALTPTSSAYTVSQDSSKAITIATASK